MVNDRRLNAPQNASDRRVDCKQYSAMDTPASDAKRIIHRPVRIFRSLDRVGLVDLDDRAKVDASVTTGRQHCPGGAGYESPLSGKK